MDIAILALICLVVAIVGVTLLAKRSLPALPPSDKSEAPSLAQASADPGAPSPAQLPAAPATTDRLHDDRFRIGLGKTRAGFVAKLDALLRGKPKVDSNLREELETVLYGADIGAVTAERLLEEVHATLSRSELADREAVWKTLEQTILGIVDMTPPPAVPVDPPPYVLLAVGVNGVGKTTTLAKLGARAVAEGKKVLLVAGDTFRAAATEQLQTWAERIGAGIHVGKQGADPAGVIHEGIARGRREGYDMVLCDTAGRLHTRKELMDELNKIYRSASKALSAATATPIEPHDVFLILDATIGQNALAQAQLFKDTVKLTGIVVTKLDGTAKGGVVLGICDTMRVPIRWVGLGEKAEDLQPFAATRFVHALLDRDDNA